MVELNYFFTLFFIASVALCTYLLHNKWRLNAIQASSLMGVVLGLAIQLNWAEYFPYTKTLYWAFGATFVGMTSKEWSGSLSMFLMGLIYGIMIQLVDQDIAGIGGGLGTLACVVVLFFLTLTAYLKKKI